MPDDRGWAERLRSGDRSALEELFRDHYTPLVAFAARLLRSEELAEETVQDVFYSIWKHRERDALPPQNIRAYLYSAVHKGATSRLRKRTVEQRWLDRVSRGEQSVTLPVSHATDEHVRFNDLVVAVRRAIDELPERTRLAFLLSRDRGLSYPEIAQEMGTSVKTVESQIARALRTMRERLGRFYE